MHLQSGCPRRHLTKGPRQGWAGWPHRCPRQPGPCGLGLTPSQAMAQRPPHKSPLFHVTAAGPPATSVVEQEGPTFKSSEQQVPENAGSFQEETISPTDVCVSLHAVTRFWKPSVFLEMLIRGAPKIQVPKANRFVL